MADSKVSELTAASSLGGSDVFYLVQSGASKKITASTVFSNASNVTLKGNLNFESTVQLLSSPGIIDLTKQVTHLSVDASGGTITIPPGTTNQQKIICLISSAGGTYTMNSNVAGNANVIFDVVGDTATMLYTNSKWFFIGGTANVVYP